MADFSEDLRKAIADEEAGVIKVLRDSGYTKAVESEPVLDFSDCSDPRDYSLKTGRHLFRVAADKWTQMLRNNGNTDEEAVNRKFLRDKDDYVAEPRTLADAMKDMKELFDITLTEVTEDIEKAAPDMGREIVRDTMSRVQFPQIMNRVIELPMMEPIEPVYVLQGLFKSINVPGMFGDQVTFQFPILGALEPAEMGEDAEVPEKEIDLAGGAMVAKFAKIGVGFKYSSDFDRFANFDWFGMLTRACRQALSRERELRAYYHISQNGSTVIDNRGRFGLGGTADANTVGSAGTGIDGLHNGTHVLQDIFYMMTDFNEDGLFPDTVVLSPRAWLIWAQSPEMRAFAWQHGIPQLWQMPQGKAGRATEHEAYSGLLGPHGDHPRGSSQFTTPPSYLPMSMRIVVSPFVNSGTSNSIEYTDAHVLDVSAGIGYIIENMPVTLTEWMDMAHDMRNIRFRERYAFGVLQESETIRHMRSLKTREIGVDARDRLWFNVSWAGGVGGPDLGNPA